MFARLALIVALAAISAFCEDWDPRPAAKYLDSRQEEWFAWPRAKAFGGPCVSCHTGMTYLLVRPALRRALGESQPTSYETGLLDGLRARVDKTEPQQLSPGAKEPGASQKLGVESIFAALFLAQYDAESAEAKRAFERLWALQLRDGSAKGAWAWFEFNLDPWETPESVFYGATLAAVAAGSLPAEYRDRPELRERLEALVAYLQREQGSQPLHNRLALLWAASKLPGVLAKPQRKAIIEEVLRQQQPDSGWTIASLGSWRPHPQAPLSSGSSAYATGFTAFVLQTAGVARKHRALRAAIDWLRSNQDRQSGSWAADSMNKPYEPDSMPARFMRDAATAFAAMALLEGGERRRAPVARASSNY